MIERFETTGELSSILSGTVVRDGLIYITGRAMQAAKEGKLQTMREQAEGLRDRFEELLNIYGSHKNNILFTEIFITDMSLKSEFDEVWGNWLSEGYAPARVCVGVELQKGLLLEITMIAEKLISE